MSFAETIGIESQGPITTNNVPLVNATISVDTTGHIQSHKPDFTLNDFQSFVNNLVSSRADFWKAFSDPRRDIAAECGHPKDITDPQAYEDMYQRNPIAARVVQVLPRECWQVQPTIFEDDDSDVVTEFEEAWDGLSKQLRGEHSWYQDEAGSPIQEILCRADIQARKGQFGIILIGINDGKDLSEPASFVNKNTEDGGTDDSAPPPETNQDELAPTPTPTQEAKSPGRKNGKVKLEYLRVFSQASVRISKWDDTLSSKRFNQPVEYQITFGDPRQANQGTVGMGMVTARVHWTRVIHITDNLDEGETLGTPAMRPVYNNLMDLDKLYGGSAEMYWRGALPGWALETHPILGGEARIDEAKLRKMMENYAAGLQRYLALMGMSAKSLAPQVVDPTPQILTQIEAICIQLGIPKRVFMGSERGELASSQDDAAWNDRLRQRQDGYITPRIIVPFVDRLIALGILPKPKGYSVWWPDLTSQTESEKADIAFKYTQALALYVEKMVEAMITPLDYLVHFLNFDEEEAQQMVDNAVEHKEEREAEEMVKQAELIEKGLAPDPTAPKVIAAPPGTDPSKMAGGKKPTTPAPPKNGQAKVKVPLA